MTVNRAETWAEAPNIPAGLAAVPRLVFAPA
jgi:hypothetical protein